jgi:hypothetical protein
MTLNHAGGGRRGSICLQDSARPAPPKPEWETGADRRENKGGRRCWPVIRLGSEPSWHALWFVLSGCRATVDNEDERNSRTAGPCDDGEEERAYVNDGLGVNRRGMQLRRCRS